MTGQPEWGMHPATMPAGVRPRALRLGRLTAAATRRAAALLLMITTTALILAGPAVAASTDARADFLGIGDAVEDMICGLVDPEEPWEGVGDGPEGWLANRNLTGVGAITPPRIAFNGRDVTVDTTSVGKPIEPSPDTMDKISGLPGGDYTLYEVAGLRGLSWWTIPLTPNGSDRNCSVWAYMWTWAANGLFTVNKVLLQVTISIKEAASTSSPLAFLYDDTQSTVSTLFVAFFVPIACLMLLFTAVYAGIRSIKEGHARFLLSSLLVFIAVGLGATLMYGLATTDGNGFRSALKVTDEFIAGINDMSAQVLLDELADGQGNCQLPDQADVPARGQRITSCVLADTLAYRPWAIGQFGGAGASPIPLPQLPAPASVKVLDVKPGVRVGSSIPPMSTSLTATLPCYVDFHGCNELRSYLIAQHGGISIGGRFSGSDGSAWCVTTLTGGVTFNMFGNGITIPNYVGCSPMWQVFWVLAGSDYSAATAYSGDVGMARVSQALVSIIGTLVAGIAVLITALLTMLWHGKTFGLWLIGPFKLAISVSKSSVRMAKEWAADLVWAQACRIAYGILLTIVILVIAFLLQSTLPFGLRLVWLGVILFSFWKIISKVQTMLKPGAASEAGDLRDKTVDVAKRSVNRTVQTVGATTERARATGTGAQAALERRRIVAQDPGRGRLSRAISPLATAAVVAGAATKGAVTGSSASTQARTKKVSDRTQKTAEKEPSKATSKTRSENRDQPRQAQPPAAEQSDQVHPPTAAPTGPAGSIAAPEPRAIPVAPGSERLDGPGTSQPGSPDRQLTEPRIPQPLRTDREDASAPSRDTARDSDTPDTHPSRPAGDEPQRSDPGTTAGGRPDAGRPDAGRPAVGAAEPSGHTNSRESNQPSPLRTPAQHANAEPASETPATAEPEQESTVIPRWRASFHMPEVSPTPGVPERISREPEPTAPAPPLY